MCCSCLSEVLFFGHRVVPDPLWPHGPQHARLPCASPSRGVCSETHIHWVGDAIELSHPLSSLLLLPSAFHCLGVLSMSRLFASGGRYWRFSVSPSDGHSKVCSSVTQSCPTLHDPVEEPAGSSVHGLSRQEYWSGLPFPSPIQRSNWP